MNMADIETRFAQLHTDIGRCMERDRHRFYRSLRQQRERLKRGEAVDKGLKRLQGHVEASLAVLESRQQLAPSVTYPDLPISAHADDIRAALQEHQVVVVAGETGSGKTTQLPKICLELGRGIGGMIGHTQPRRLAARTVAQRIAEELDTELGNLVGYQVRFTDHSGDNTLVKLMTDGILLAEIQNDRFLNRYDTLIIDEAHERSLNIDFLLGFLKQLLPKRPELKVIITSATIDVERFAQHFDGAPVIQVSGRTYPVEVRYSPPADNDDSARAVVDALEEIRSYERNHAEMRGGDVLVFLPGEREIRETALAIRHAELKHTEVLPLYARLNNADQQRVFKREKSAGRRVILATNVAETSLTVPGIRYVIDTGFARISRYSHRTKVQRLPVEAVSQASANQRMGRCGRIGNGLCIRLYEQEDFERRPEFTDAEILRTNLASVILQMLALRLGDISAFPFVDPPDSRMVNDGVKLLEELGAIESRGKLSDLGRKLARLPLDPRLGRMVLAAGELGSTREMLIIASALSVQDPRERPQEKQQAADEMHRRFAHPGSDFMGLVNLWNYYEEQRQALSQNQLRKLCKKEFLSFMRMREWRDIHHQLKLAVKELEFKGNDNAGDDAIHRALLTGLLSHIGFQHEPREFLGARNRKFRLFPGSALAKKPPKWVMVSELIETRFLFGHTAAKIEPEWVLECAGNLLKRQYYEPHYHRKSGQVMAFEKVTLYGLQLSDRKRVSYGKIDQTISHELFIRGALVEGHYTGRGEFFQHNTALLEELSELESRTRRRDIVADDEALFRFYAERIPGHVVNLRGFENWRKKTETRQPKLLFAERHQLSLRAVDSDTEAQFPKSIHWKGIDFQLRYRFEPGHVEDGVSVVIPVALLNQTPRYLFEWLVPGMLRDKCIDIVKSLPKPQRKHFVPVPDFVDRALAEMRPEDTPLISVLFHALKRVSAITLPAELVESVEVDPHYCMFFDIVDVDGQRVGAGRDFDALRNEFAATAEQSLVEESSGEFERRDLQNWDFGDLPESYSFKRGGLTLRAFPALLDRNTHVDLELMENRDRALRLSRPGINRLFMLALPDKVKYLRRQLLKGNQWSLFCAGLGVRQEALLNDLVAAVFDAVFLDGQKLPRTETEFRQRIEKGKNLLIEKSQAYEALLSSVAPLFQEVRSAVKGNVSPTFIYAISDIRAQLDHLFRANFLRSIAFANLRHYPRYLKAIRLRQEKLAGNYQRDRQLMQEIDAHWQRIVAVLAEESKVSPWDERFQTYRWMVEEWRVSVFAQQLGTAQPVSEKRLDKLWAEMTR